MKTTRFIRCELSGLIALGFAFVSGCAYRLPVSNLPSQQRLMIVARSPERYVVHVKASDTAEFPVSRDGRVTIDVPRLPRASSVYLFNLIRINGGVKPLTSKSVQLLDSGYIATKLSLAEIEKLPSDASGYHILKMKK
jgi:hypothetical protein